MNGAVRGMFLKVFTLLLMNHQEDLRWLFFFFIDRKEINAIRDNKPNQNL